MKQETLDSNLQQWDADDLTEFADELTPLCEGQDLDDATQDKVKGLDADRSFLTTPRHRTYIDLRAIADVKTTIGRLPNPGESLHIVISGRYPLFAIVPATLELSGAKITQLHLVTLSYSKDNAADLIELIDRKQIGKVWLLVSHYFSSANASLYDPLAAELTKRKHKVLAMRTHAKIILMKLSDGRKFVVESSANLRSCKNIEQATLIQDAGLWKFHRDWIEGIFNGGNLKDR